MKSEEWIALHTSTVVVTTHVFVFQNVFIGQNSVLHVCGLGQLIILVYILFENKNRMSNIDVKSVNMNLKVTF